MRMCAILDANLIGDVFKADADPAARQFFDWMNSTKGRMVVGGELRRELEKVGAYLVWSQQAILTGRLQQVSDELVDFRAAEIAGDCRSDDPHVIALAQISGARLLYSNDNDLRADFRNRSLVHPRGRLLPDGQSEGARKQRQSLLNQPDLCPQHRR